MAAREGALTERGEPASPPPPPSAPPPPSQPLPPEGSRQVAEAIEKAAAHAAKDGHQHALHGSGRPCSLYRDASGALHRDLSAEELAAALAADTGTLWVDVDTADRRQSAVLQDVFHFHPLAIEDALNPRSRVKLEEFPGYLFLIVRGLRFCEDTAEDPYDVETFNLAFFLGKRFLVTVHGEESRSVLTIQERVARSPELLDRGVERLMHAITDLSVDAYFPIVDQLDEFIDSLEQRVFVDFDQAALRDVFSVKRLVLQLRRELAPQREVFNVLTNRPSTLMSPETQVYFRDVYDHVLRINDSLDTYRELLSSTLDSYLSQVSNRLGQVTKGLSVVATLSLPFVVISGMWGMNVEHIPFSHEPHAFLVMVVLQLAIGVALVALLKWRKLL
ncbi:MAG TPA: magnesium transporter CorA family protein [Gemmatimonadaceae bacterium]|nr:magnesium transporter CorA family protein [Gemmatimonadaceae bacterium]